MNGRRAAPYGPGQATWTKGGAAWLLVLLGGAVCWAAPDIVIRGDDFVEVGRKTTLAFVSADGATLATMRWALIGRTTLGKLSVYRQATFINDRRVEDIYATVTDQEIAAYRPCGGPAPDWKVRLPLRKGMAYAYQSSMGKVKTRVEGPEEIEVPAGKFTCLVYIQELESEGRKRVWREWFAPGVGTVKFTMPGRQGLAVVLTSLTKGGRRAPQPGAVVLSDFDAGDPLASVLFPERRWEGAAGSPQAVSTCDIEPVDSAAGTPFSLRWAYHTKATWVNAALVVADRSPKPLDLSRYNSISFHIKGLTGRSCRFKLEAPGAGRGGRGSAEVPVKVTTEWQRVVIPLKTQPELRGADLTNVYTLEFVDSHEQFASNVVWIDEVMLHPAKPHHRERR